ncbi:Guanine nucleotide-binding protein G(t) subunit alpha-3 [Termitomyces sp. J132]|nr:Guanine nucleotide-binding protein G(t) subunit alpha-3 [Termitomyces sp. J132]
MKVSENDPFAIFITPPENETPAEKSARERRETEEKRISDRIDEEIKAEKAAMKKQRAVVKVLLLGQSESGMFKFFFYVHQEFDCGDFDLTGKSTTLKNFRMKYARAAWKVERLSWRVVIQLNLIRSIITIVEALQAEMDGEPIRPLPVPRPPLTCAGKRSNAPPPRKSIDSEFLDSDMDTWAQHNSREKANAVDDATEVIAECKQDMGALWVDPTVKAVLKRRRIRLEDSAGFFLDDLDRIATKHYEPTDDDIVRARLRTLGIQEYKIEFEQNNSLMDNVGLTGNFGQEWKLYDVGGARTVRNAWLPYFEGVNAIIFRAYFHFDYAFLVTYLVLLSVAPISCFDERLLEDPDVNRLEDSFLLWRAVCSSKILAKTTMILFLNKCDILRRKLKSGARVKDFLPSYGDRPNDARSFTKYLKDKFRDTLRQHSPEPRVSYFYATSVTVSTHIAIALSTCAHLNRKDTKATATTLKTVRDSILREHLKDADFV